MNHLFRPALRRAAALALTLALAVWLALPGLAAYPMPVETTYPDESVYLFDLDTGKTILEQNADQPRYVASLTKMMTALLYLESGLDLQQAVTVPASLTQEFTDIQNANGSTIGLRIGETVRRIDLLYGVIVASGNDAASAVASDASGGDLTAFVARMNQRAAELGCTDTTFSCVHGLYDYGNVSTARDLAKIAAACYAQPQYMEIAQTASYTLPATNLHTAEREIRTTNLMLDPEYPYYRDYIRGMKTGFTTLAGRCFVTFAEQNGHTYGLVVLGSDLDNIYRECAELLDWVFATFGDRQLVDTETMLATVPLTQCRSTPQVELYAAGPVTGYGHPDDEVTFTFDLPGGHGGPGHPPGVRLRLYHRRHRHPAAAAGPAGHFAGAGPVHRPDRGRAGAVPPPAPPGQKEVSRHEIPHQIGFVQRGVYRAGDRRGRPDGL